MHLLEKILLILCFIVLGLIFVDGYTTTEKSVFVDCYRVTAPFGVITLEGNFFIGSGSIEESEVYLIKYFENGYLKSMKLDAEDTPIIVDETFRLEIIYRVSGVTNTVFIKKYILHIPFLPEVGEQITSEWRI